MKPYRIQRPIRDLQSLRQEKRNLRLHIASSDEALRTRIRELPAVAALRTLRQLGSFLIQTTGAKAMSALLGGNKGKGVFWKALLKGLAVFAGTELMKRYTQSAQEEDAPEEEEEEIPDLSE
ncbi:MAG: hypothetical protein MUF29_03480 [Chitinophagaceae bacterium]|jgi:hypothetical protein|nr:hypothetical protein [Chitinophagaceae bacterium]